tara:strand:- start:23 stop:286 length:264 start_codon:yes stop_codon:yes gene_type:complete
MDNIKDMTNDQFISHLMTGYSKYGALVQMVIIDCLQKGLNEYIENEDMILEEAEAMRESGRISLVNMEAWVACCKETLNRIEDKYNG